MTLPLVEYRSARKLPGRWLALPALLWAACVPAAEPEVPESSPESGAGFVLSDPSAPVQVATTASAAGWLGVGMRQRPGAAAGVLVARVLRGSPAALAGLEPGDVVLAVNQRSVSNPAELGGIIARAGAGARLGLQVERSGRARLMGVVLGHDPGYEGQLRLGFIGAPAPELTDVELAQGQIVPSLSAQKGKVVLLEFWASWCSACRALLPTLNGWHDRFGPQGATVISVTMDPLEQAATDAFQLGMHYPVLADPEGRAAAVYQAFALPTLFLIDRDGIVRDVAVGYDPARLQRLEQRLVEMLRRG